MGVQTFVAEPAIERFHKGVVGRLARPREVQRYAVFIRPAIQGLAQESVCFLDYDAAEPVRKRKLSFLFFRVPASEKLRTWVTAQ
jgi:hypothetical protein